MFKRSLTAVAVLGTLAGASMAADVQLYGLLDTSFAYTHVKELNKPATNVYGMRSGTLAGSRLGVKGSEDIGNGLSVGFTLEAGLDSTNGGTTSGQFFDRQSTINVSGAFGSIYAGRFGVLRSSDGPFGIGNIDPLGAGTVIGGYDNVRGGFDGVIDRAIGYESPEFAGVKIYTMYGMGGTGYIDQNKSTSPGRYLGMGVKFEHGPLALVGTVDSFLKTKDSKSKFKAKNEWQVNLGASYDFGFVTPTIQLNYTKDASSYTNGLGDSESLLGETSGSYLTGFGGQLGATAPVGPGAVIATVGYFHGKAKDALLANSGEKVSTLSRINLGVAYAYELSKRTSLYTGAGWLQTKSKPVNAAEAKVKQNIIQVGAGVVHTF